MNVSLKRDQKPLGRPEGASMTLAGTAQEASRR